MCDCRIHPEGSRAQNKFDKDRGGKSPLVTRAAPSSTQFECLIMLYRTLQVFGGVGGACFIKQLSDVARERYKWLDPFGNILQSGVNTWPALPFFSWFALQQHGL